MTEYLPRVVSQTGMLDPNQSFTLSFRPLNPGPINMTSVALLHPVHPGPEPINDQEPIQRKMELYRPGVAQPIASKIEAPGTNISMLAYNATLADLKAPGNWTCKVTNLEGTAQRFHADAAFPSETQLQLTEIPLSLINQKLALLLTIAGLKLRIDSNDGWVDFSPEAKSAFGLEKIAFNAPRFDATILLFHVSLRANDIRSASVELSIQEASPAFPHGAIRARITFEDQDKEVLGTFHADVSNMVLTADLGLAAVAEKLSYGNVAVSFPIKVNFTGLPDWLLDPIFGYSGKIRGAVEGKLADLLEHGITKANGAVVDVRGTVARSLNEKVLPALLGGPVKVYSVDARAGVLTLKTYK